MKDELGGKIMKKIAKSRAKTYGYLTDNNDEDRKAKGKKSLSKKENLSFKIKNRLKAAELENKTNKKINLTKIVLRKIIKK